MMTLKWVKKFSKKVRNSEAFVIPVTFKSEYLLILAKCLNCRATWHKAGYLSHFIDIFPVGKTQIKDKKLILLNKPIIQSFLLFQLGYKLEFEFAEWIDELILEIYEPNMPIYPQSDFGAVEKITTTVAVNATPTKVANTVIGRKDVSLSVPAASGATIYFGFDNTVSTSSPYSAKAGQTWIVDIDWDGEIWAISNKPTPTTITVDEF